MALLFAVVCCKEKLSLLSNFGNGFARVILRWKLGGDSLDIFATAFGMNFLYEMVELGSVVELKQPCSGDQSSFAKASLTFIKEKVSDPRCDVSPAQVNCSFDVVLPFQRWYGQLARWFGAQYVFEEDSIVHCLIG